MTTPSSSGRHAPYLPDLGWLPPLTALAVFVFQVRRFCGSAIYFVDDPFISMRFAGNLVEHGELSFNPGDRVEGYSNLLHVLMHALDFKLRGYVPDAASGIDGVARVVLAATVLEAVVLGLLAHGARGRDRDSIAWYYAWVLTLALWPFAFWASAGLETPLEGLLYVTILWVCSLRGFRESRPWAMPACAALLVAVVLLRFEGVITAFAIGAAIVVHLVRGRRVREAWTLGLPVVAVATAYHVWRLVYFGQLAPTTFIAKATGGSTFARVHAGVSYCGGWLALLGGGVGLALLALAVARVASIKRASLEPILDHPTLLVACTVVATKVALVAWGGGDWMPGCRMLLPVTPVALFLLARILVEFMLDPSSWRTSRLAAVVLSAAVIVGGRGRGGEVFPSNDAVPNEAGNLKKFPRGNLLVGDLLERAFAGTHDEVAIGEAGLVPFVAFHVRFMDLFGLVDRDMSLQPGFMHHRVHVDHFLQRSPAAVVFAHLRELPPYGPYQYGPELLSSPAFHEKYGRVDLGSDLDALGWAVYLRRDVDPAAHQLAWAR